jgi:predicted ATPase/DNA-binding CsgD family transcriptional regulator
MIRNYAVDYHTPFVGRTKELADVAARLQNPECRLLTLTGLGGAGKTRLALEVAKTLAESFQHGVILVALQPLIKVEMLVSAIAQAVGMTFYGERELLTQLYDYIHEKKMLLLFDNFEHLLGGVEIINQILLHAPNLKILVTSREALDLRQEWLYPLKGLTTPPSIYVYPSLMEEYEAVQLFLYHARRVQPAFDVAAEQTAIIQICTLTSGLPLAIEMAASWLRGLAAAQIAQEIQRNLNFLSTTTRNIEERHRSMRAVFDHSWDLLPEAERQILAKLSLFVGGFDAASAQAVASAEFSSLAALVEKSLVQMEFSNRFAIHELLRQYSMEKLRELGEMDATYARHSRYFADRMLIYEDGLKQPQQLEVMRTIELDFDNIRLAWDWSSRNHLNTNLHQMLHGLYLFGFLRSRYSETTALFKQTLDDSVADIALLGRLLSHRWGYLQWWYLSDYREALAGIEQALAIAISQNDAFETAFCHLMVGYALNSMQRYTEALSYLEASRKQFEAINQPYYVCWALHRLGYVYSNMNDIEKAKLYTEESLVLARATYNQVGLVICLYNLGSDYILEGNYLKGKTYCAEALQVANELRHAGQIAHALSLIALCDFFLGNYLTAKNDAERSHHITEEINMLVFKPYSLAVLLLLACLREDYAEAIRLNDVSKPFQTNLMGYQLLYWALAILWCGLENRTEARVYVQNLFQLHEPGVTDAIPIWIIPAAIYLIAENDIARAVELIAWVRSYSDIALNWVREWPFIDRLQKHLQESLSHDVYQYHWDIGKTRTFDTIDAELRREFLSEDAQPVAANSKLLTSRETEILRLLAAGLTNPQISQQLVIGVGTVKTHTLSIYRKLDVANRTQAIVRAQELGLLST